jgi:hypothetical protein
MTGVGEILGAGTGLATGLVTGVRLSRRCVAFFAAGLGAATCALAVGFPTDLVARVPRLTAAREPPVTNIAVQRPRSKRRFIEFLSPTGFVQSLHRRL